MPIQELDAAKFRRTLAGLEDVTANQQEHAEDYRELASDFVLLLAICFNRKQLDPITLWKRIDSGIQKSIAESNGDDLDRLVSSALEHVLAEVSVTASLDDAVEIQTTLSELTRDQRIHFISYLAKHRYAAIMIGRRKWEERKADKKFQKQLTALQSEDEV